MITVFRETSPFILITQPAEGEGARQNAHTCHRRALCSSTVSLPPSPPGCWGVTAVVLCHVGDGESNGQPRAVPRGQSAINISCPTCSSPSPAHHLLLHCSTAIFSRKQVTTPSESPGVLVGFIFLLQICTVSSSLFGTFKFGLGREPAAYVSSLSLPDGEQSKIILTVHLFKPFFSRRVINSTKASALITVTTFIELQSIENSNMLVESQTLLLFTKECARTIHNVFIQSTHVY